LPPSQFIRVHRSYIASVSYITVIRNSQVEMPGMELPIGISYKDDLFKSLGNDQ